MNKHGVSRSWFTKADVKDFKSGRLRTIKNFYVELKKKSQLYLKILLIDTEQISKVEISLQVFFKDFFDRFGTTNFKTGFL